jgi:CPA1 family monovalent cation:H+ antiporter
MVTVGFVVTWLVCALAARAFVDMPWPIAALFGAIMVVTGPTVIMPLVRAVRPNARIANILRWEGILIDPIGAILAVLCFNVVVAAGIGAAAGEAALVLARMLLSGLLVGAGLPDQRGDPAAGVRLLCACGPGGG